MRVCLSMAHPLCFAKPKIVFFGTRASDYAKKFVFLLPENEIADELL